jgi:hypothetical protein
LSKRIYFDFSYLIVLAASFGAIITLGALVAPVVFHTDRIITEVIIDQYNAGIIMGTIFYKFSYWTYFLAAFVSVFEAAQYKMGHRDSIAIVSAFIVVFTSMMFSAVYVPKILEMQALGHEATQSDTFKNIHMGSEVDFKILAFSLVVLFVRRLMLLRRA